jgi:hypothetical protein
MKKLLLLTVALTSFMAHAMYAMEPVISSGNAGQGRPTEKEPIRIAIPNPLIAQTPLGTIFRMQVNSAIIGYELKINDNKAVSVVFDQMRQEFRGAIHTNGRCEPIESQAEVKAQFDKIKAAFDAAPNKTRKFNI